MSREESHADMVGMSMNAISCEACSHPLTSLGSLQLEAFDIYYWWECENCDRVWYINQVAGQMAQMLEWRNHPTVTA